MSRRDLLPDAGPVLSLRQALYRASRDYRGGQNALALTMGVPADELAKRLNPNDSRPLKVCLLYTSDAADGRWEKHEVEALEQHGNALLRQLLGIMAGARAAMEGGEDE